MKRTDKPLPFVQALAELSGEDKPTQRALRALSDLNADRIAELKAELGKLDSNRRAWIVDHLRMLSDDDIEVDFNEIFRVGLSDADSRVRLASVKGLWEDEKPSLISPLITLLKRDPSDEVRAAAAEALGRFLYAGEIESVSKPRRDEIYKALLSVVRHTPDDSPVYQCALASLGYAATDDVDFFLRSAIASDNDNLQLSAVIAMGRSDNTAYAPLVRAELHHVSPHVRREAARASGELEDMDAVKDLGVLIDDSDASVREAALGALAEIGGIEAKRLLENTAATAEDELKEQATQALEQHGMLHGEFDFNMQIFDDNSRS